MVSCFGGVVLSPACPLAPPLLLLPLLLLLKLVMRKKFLTFRGKSLLEPWACFAPWTGKLLTPRFSAGRPAGLEADRKNCVIFESVDLGWDGSVQSAGYDVP